MLYRKKVCKNVLGEIIMKSTWEKGRELENYIAEKFKEIGYMNACPSNGSGNKGSIGDISGVADFAVECKLRNTKDITVKEEVWNELVNSIPLSSERTPLYVLENKNKKRWVVMDVEEFFGLLENWGWEG